MCSFFDVFDACLRASTAEASSSRDRPVREGGQLVDAIVAVLNSSVSQQTTTSGCRSKAAVERSAACGSRQQKRHHRVKNDRDEMARPQQIRRSYNRVTQVSLGEEALEARAQWLAATRSPRGWLATFVAERYHVEDMMCEAAKAARREVRSAVRAATLGTVRTTGVQGTAQKCWHRNVSARNRLRRAGAGRPVLAPEVGEELWSWFVDRLHNVPARVNSNLLLTQARIFVSDVQECWRRRAEFGEADPEKPPRLPIIDQNWITRWRRAHGVTWRTVNLRYKISAAKRNLRVRVFWSNVLRLRFFHAALFGENKVRFVGFDQKPLYFNSSLVAKTLAL